MTTSWTAPFAHQYECGIHSQERSTDGRTTLAVIYGKATTD